MRLGLAAAPGLAIPLALAQAGPVEEEAAADEDEEEGPRSPSASIGLHVPRTAVAHASVPHAAPKAVDNPTACARASALLLVTYAAIKDATVVKSKAHVGGAVVEEEEEAVG